MNVTGADGLRMRYAPAAGFAFSYTFDPQGNLSQRLRYGSVVSTSGYDGFGYPEYFYSASQNDASYEDAVGFGGQFGYYYDPETGLSLLTHRYYDPVNGRFLTRDPIGYEGGLNLYSLGLYNPVNNQDPSGFSGDSVLGGLKHGINNAAEGIAQTAEATASVLEAGTSVIDSGTHFLSAGASAITNAPAAVSSVAAAIVTSTYRQLRNAGLSEKHHIIQHAAMLGQVQQGYTRDDALAVQRDGPSWDRATPHGLTRIVQQQLGGGNFAAEVRIGYKALRRSGMQLHEARGHIANAVAYFNSIGVGPNTPTIIPADRRTGFRRGLRR